jgi:hypothetical protein
MKKIGVLFGIGNGIPDATGFMNPVPGAEVRPVGEAHR